MAAENTVVTFLLQNLSRLLIKEVKLLYGVEGKIASLCKQFKFMDIFLKISAEKHNDPLVKKVVNQIRDVAHKAEDLVDIYIANVLTLESRSILKKLLYSKGHAMMLYEINLEIEKIRSSVDQIYKNTDRYSIGEGEFKGGDNEAAELLLRRRRDVDVEDVVQDSSGVLKQLMKSGSRCCVGMGGLGKTTLTWNIYPSDEVKQYFPCRAWGYVFNDYNANELLLSLLQCLMSTTSEYIDLNEEEQKKKVHECLIGEKLVIVLDNIWKSEG